MKNTIYIPVNNKKVKLIYTADPNYEWAIIVDCDEAWLHQWFLIEDLWWLIENIPHMVEQRKAKKENFVKIRVTEAEKNRLSELSVKQWYPSISAYIRDVALS